MVVKSWRRSTNPHIQTGKLSPQVGCGGGGNGPRESYGWKETMRAVDQPLSKSVFIKQFLYVTFYIYLKIRKLGEIQRKMTSNTVGVLVIDTNFECTSTICSKKSRWSQKPHSRRVFALNVPLVVHLQCFNYVQ